MCQGHKSTLPARGLDPFAIMAPPINNSATTSESGVIDCMRRLSIDSGTSSFSIISAPASVLSLASDDSIAGGVVVVTTPELLEIRPTEQYVQENAAASTRSTVLESDGTETSDLSEAPRRDTANSGPPKSSPFWLQFDTFVPEPRAPFRDEFNRLSRHQKWGKQKQKQQKNKALTAEISFHFSQEAEILVSLQDLCEEHGVGNDPTSITQCKKVSILYPISHLNFEHRSHISGTQIRIRKHLRHYRSPAMPRL